MPCSRPPRSTRTRTSFSPALHPPAPNAARFAMTLLPCFCLIFSAYLFWVSVRVVCFTRVSLLIRSPPPTSGSTAAMRAPPRDSLPALCWVPRQCQRSGHGRASLAGGGGLFAVESAPRGGGDPRCWKRIWVGKQHLHPGHVVLHGTCKRGQAASEQTRDTAQHPSQGARRSRCPRGGCQAESGPHCGSPASGIGSSPPLLGESLCRGAPAFVAGQGKDLLLLLPPTVVAPTQRQGWGHHRLPKHRCRRRGWCRQCWHLLLFCARAPIQQAPSPTLCATDCGRILLCPPCTGAPRSRKEWRRCRY